MSDYSCTVCGTELEKNTDCYGHTSGEILDECDGFCPSDCSPWIEVMCFDCHDKVQAAIADIRAGIHN